MKKLIIFEWWDVAWGKFHPWEMMILVTSHFGVMDKLISDLFECDEITRSLVMKNEVVWP